MCWQPFPAEYLPTGAQHLMVPSLTPPEITCPLTCPFTCALTCPLICALTCALTCSLTCALTCALTCTLSRVPRCEQSSPGLSAHLGAACSPQAKVPRSAPAPISLRATTQVWHLTCAQPELGAPGGIQVPPRYLGSAFPPCWE